MPGTLYVVATPIGNLEDITLRAIRVLREVTLIAAEDTRRTAKLLTHYGIHTPVVSLREHNEARETPRLVARLMRGETVALVSDAGTPGVSDPGARFVRAARQHGVRVAPLPGASAVLTALAGSGIAADQFVFLGYPPTAGEARREWIESLTRETRTAVFFEAPHRIERTLADLASVLVNRPTVLGRELTKIHEELVEWPMSPSSLRGEFVIVVAGAHGHETASEISASLVGNVIGCLTNAGGIGEPDAIQMTAKALGVPSARIRKLLKQERYATKAASDRRLLDDT